MIFFFINFIYSTIYGLDFGWQNVRVAIGVPGKPIEILISEQGFRSTPNFLSFSLEANESDPTNAEWFTGSEGERIFYKNSSFGVQNPFSFLNNPKDLHLKFIDPVTLASIAFSIHLPKFNRKHDKLIVAVPSIFSPQARKNMIESLKLLNISSAQLLNSNTALAAYYSIERLKKGDNIIQKVLFIDIGAIQTEISLWRFEKTAGIIKLYLEDFRMNDEIGGIQVDNRIFEWIKNKLNHEPSNSEIRNILKLIRKSKERLAAGVDSIIDLKEDFGIEITLTNELVSNLISDLNENLFNLLKNMNLPEEIELIGGSTRLPCFYNEIQKSFPNITLKRSLNSDEAVAIGSAYYASLQTGTVAGSRLEVIKSSIYGLDFIFNNKKSNIFESGDENDRKSITLRKFNDFNFSLFLTFNNKKLNNIILKNINELNKPYTINSITNLKQLTRNVTSQLANNTIPFIRLIFGISNTLDCIDFLSASLSANVTINITIKGEVNNVDSTSVSWNLRTNSNLIDDDYNYNLTNSLILINNFLEYRNSIKRLAASRHKLETFIIDLTDKINYDSDFLEITTSNERFEILQLLSREKQTIEISGQRVSSLELERRLEKLKEKLFDILFKLEEFKQRPRAIKKLNSTINKAELALINATTDNETIEDFKKYLEASKDLINNTLLINPLEKPLILVKELIEREKRLLRKIPDLKSPPRKPKTISFSTNPKSSNYIGENYDELSKMGIKIEKSKDLEENSTLNDNL